jgi:transposase
LPDSPLNSDNVKLVKMPRLPTPPDKFAPDDDAIHSRAKAKLSKKDDTDDTSKKLSFGGGKGKRKWDNRATGGRGGSGNKSGSGGAVYISGGARQLASKWEHRNGELLRIFFQETQRDFETKTQWAEHFGVDVRTVYRWIDEIKNGRMLARKAGSGTTCAVTDADYYDAIDAFAEEKKYDFSVKQLNNHLQKTLGKGSLSTAYRALYSHGYVRRRQQTKPYLEERHMHARRLWALDCLDLRAKHLKERKQGKLHFVVHIDEKYFFLLSN